jgi:hypothetical protein
LVTSAVVLRPVKVSVAVCDPLPRVSEFVPSPLQGIEDLQTNVPAVENAVWNTMASARAREGARQQSTRSQSVAAVLM